MAADKIGIFAPQLTLPKPASWVYVGGVVLYLKKRIRNMKTLLSLWLCVICLSLSAQPAINWQVLYGQIAVDDVFNDVVVNNDGSYLVVGEQSGLLTLYDYNLLAVKISASGDTLWSVIVGDSIADKALSVVASPDGGYVIAGTTTSLSGMFATNHGLVDAWVLKLDAAGALVWSHTYGGSGADEVFSLTTDQNGNYYVAGYTESTDFGLASLGFSDAWVLKINESGELLWQRTYGGTAFEQFRAIAYNASAQQLIAVGSGSSSDYDLSNDPPMGGRDMWVAKIDPLTGVLVSSRTYGGSTNDLATSLAVTPDGGVIVLGDTLSEDGDITQNAGLDDWWVFKTDFMGNMVWQKTIGQAANDLSRRIALASDGHVFLLGYTFDPDIFIPNYFFDIRVVKLRQSDGETVWQQRYGGSQYDLGNGIAIANDGIVIVGATDSSDGDVGSGLHSPDSNGGGLRHGSHNAWFIHLDETIIGIDTPDSPKAASISAYPNPAMDRLYLHLSADLLPHLDIQFPAIWYDTIGREVARQNLPTPTTQGILDLSIPEQLPSGNYHLLLPITTTTQRWVRIARR